MRKYTHRRVVRKGKKDGRDWRYTIWPFKREKTPEPKTDQKIPAQYEIEIMKAAENDIALQAEKWKEIDKDLKPTYCTAVTEAELARKTSQKETEEAQAAQIEFNAAKKKYEALSLPRLSAKWGNIWLIFIALAEFPLNRVVFNVFAESQILTLIFAAGLCVMLPLFGHFMGVALRQEFRNRTEKIILIAMPAIMAFVLAVTAFLRGKYFEVLKIQNIIGVSLTPMQLTIIFMIINVLFFFAAMIVSFESTHPQKSQYAAIVNRYRMALKRLEKEAAEATDAGKTLKRAEIKLQRLRQKRLKMHEQFVQMMRSIVDNAEWLISAYRAANLRERKDIPPCFLNQPQLSQIPDNLLTLDWNCEKPGEKS